MMRGRDLLGTVAGRRLALDEADALFLSAPLDAMMEAAEALTLDGWRNEVTFSSKVFIPLSQLCRDVCHYCTFAQTPRAIGAPYMTIEQVVAIAKAGAAAGCKEALFTLGDKPELRYKTARDWLHANGCETTLDYLAAAARAVTEQTGLLPHLNPGVMKFADAVKLREVSASMGLMLETASPRLSERGQPHWGSPDKAPRVRLQSLEALGEARVPTTTGLLIGIGETRRERLEALLAIRDLDDAHGHIQEVIIQNFRAKPGTRMSASPEPALEEQIWTIAAARILFGPNMSLQAPPNLRPDALSALLRAGVNDWGGVSPVTIDHVNPEAPWPHLVQLAESTARAGRRLVERLAIAPRYALALNTWCAPKMRQRVLSKIDTAGLARENDWRCGSSQTLPSNIVRRAASDRPTGEVRAILDRVEEQRTPTQAETVKLFAARGADFDAVIACADTLRVQQAGAEVTYVVNRNINYTNICVYHCGFCAFSKGGGDRDLRGPAYNLDLDEISRRAAEAWERGATEVCLQGGIHPQFTGDAYLNVLHAVRAGAPDIHIHAFSPLEVSHGAATLGLSLPDYLARLKAAGLSTLPGTAAEILDDEVRDLICPDKLRTDTWLDIVRHAHRAGLRTTATMMFGHVERETHWARHLSRIRALQAETGGFTEFVPLGFVHHESPMWRKGLTRCGPTLREALLVHAVARIVLGDLIPNSQTSWVKMGPAGAALCLKAGANDLGGTLMDESITRAAGGAHGQQLTAADMNAIAAEAGRPAVQRTTLYDRTQCRRVQPHGVTRPDGDLMGAAPRT